MTAGSGVRPWKAGRGPIPRHRHWLALPSPALLQRSSAHVPGGATRQLSACLIAGPFPRLAMSCQPLCSRCRCPELQPLKQERGVSQCGCGLALAGQAAEGRGRSTLPVLQPLPSRFYPAKPPRPCLRSAVLRSSHRQVAWQHPPLPATAGVWRCTALAWAAPCLSLKASCLRSSAICGALGAPQYRLQQRMFPEKEMA